MNRVLLAILLLESCAVLHHAQVGDIDGDDRHFQMRPFDVKVSEMGFNIEEAGKIAKALSTSEKGKEAADSITAILGLFQMGPKTGNPSFSDTYAREMLYKLYEVCPSGRITAVTSIRETRKYPVISGEIVRITGICMVQRGEKSSDGATKKKHKSKEKRDD